MNQNERELELYEVLMKRQQEPPTPPEVLAELREWWEERDREWKEQVKTNVPPVDV